MGGVDFLSGMFNLSIPLYFWKKQKKNVEENKLGEAKRIYSYSLDPGRFFLTNKKLDFTLIAVNDPIGNNPRFTVATPSDYLESVTRLRRVAEEAERDPSTIGLAYSASWLNDREAQRLPNGDRRLLTGSPDQVADDIKAFADIGVRHFMFNFQSHTLEETLARMERFATTVRPRVER